MIPPAQREALTVLAELCELSEDMRLGQLVAWIGDLGEIQTDRKLGDIEDGQLLAVLYLHRDQLAARRSGSQKQALPPSAPPISVSESSSIPGESHSSELRG